MHSVALSGLGFVNALVPGANTPVCSLSRLDFVDLWFGAFPRTAIKRITIPYDFLLSFRRSSLLMVVMRRCPSMKSALMSAPKVVISSFTSW